MTARIMIVEDEGIIAEDLKVRVEHLGHHVVAKVRSAEDALRIADAEQPDLVLMDIALAGEMDGIEAAEIMGSTSAIPVVFISSHVDDERLTRVKPTRPFGYILKPFSGRELKLTVEMALHISEIEQGRRHAEEQQRRLLHDVQRHQEELTCQNEELRVAEEELKCQNEELKEAQQQLTASRNRYQDLFDNAPVGFATTDRKGRLCEVNLTLGTMLGRERSELIGQPLSIFMVDNDQDACYLHLQQARAALDSRQPASCELQMRGKGSTPLWVRLETIPVGVEEPILRTAVSDVSRRRQAEAALDDERRLFEQRVRETRDR